MPKVKLFQSKLMIETLGSAAADDLLNDFRIYKEQGVLPSTFGRDAPYTFTQNRSYLELQHIHIKADGEEFPLRLVQFSRTSDYVLVYCPAYFDRNTFLLITVIKHWNFKKPHETSGTDKDADLMAKLE